MLARKKTGESTVDSAASGVNQDDSKARTEEVESSDEQETVESITPPDDPERVSVQMAYEGDELEAGMFAELENGEVHQIEEIEGNPAAIIESARRKPTPLVVG